VDVDEIFVEPTLAYGVIGVIGSDVDFTAQKRRVERRPSELSNWRVMSASNPEHNIRTLAAVKA